MSHSLRAVICAATLLAGAAACGTKPNEEAEEEPPLPVAVEPIQIDSIQGVVSAAGVVNVLPGAEFAAAAPQPARIAELSVDAGDRVKSGDVLVLLEFPSLRAELAAQSVTVAAAERRLQNARAIQSRINSLVERGAASRRESEAADQEAADAEAALARARAGQRAADTLQEQATIRAPFDGVVAERLHNPGDMVGVSAEDLILRLIDPRQVEVVAAIDVASLSRFTTGASARIVAEGKLASEPARVVSRPEPTPGAAGVSVRLAFEQPTELTPGTQVAIEIDAEQRSNVLLVPSIAIVSDEAGVPVVFVAAGNRAQRRPVTTGLTDATRTEIQSGIQAGELVITEGQTNVRDGMEITFSR